MQSVVDSRALEYSQHCCFQNFVGTAVVGDVDVDLRTWGRLAIRKLEADSYGERETGPTQAFVWGDVDGVPAEVEQH